MNRMVWALALTGLLAGCSGVRELFEKEVAELNARQPEILHAKPGADELGLLPVVIQKYLKKTGFADFEKIQYVHTRYRGRIRLKADSGYLPISCEQVNSVDGKTRIWYGRAKMAPLIYFEARHIIKPGFAQMLVKFGPFTIVDLKGPELVQSDTITLYNDFLLLTPNALLDPAIRWKNAAPQAVTAVFAAGGRDVSARLTFTPEGDFLNFVTEDRYQLQGTNIVKARWETPMDRTRVRNGLTEVTGGRAVWYNKDGSADPYFIIDDPDMQITYNQKAMF